MTFKIERRFMREKDARTLLSEFLAAIRVHPQQAAQLNPPIELAKMKSIEIYLIDGKPIFARLNSKLLPTLGADRLLTALPKAIVDMAAIPHICNGADVMFPGIIRFEGAFHKGDIVVVADERHKKPIAIATALHDSKEAKNRDHGKALRTIHYVGDNLWKIISRLSQQAL